MLKCFTFVCCLDGLLKINLSLSRFFIKVNQMNQSIDFVPVIIKSLSGKTANGDVQIKSWSQSERVANAMKVFGLFFGLAIAFVFVPIVHFVMVPTLLILAPILALRSYRRISNVEGGSGTCPECSERLPIEGGKPDWPLKDLCSKCHNGLLIFLRDN